MTHGRARLKRPASASVHQLRILAIPDKGFFPLPLDLSGQIFLRLVRPPGLPTASQQVIHTLMRGLPLPGYPEPQGVALPSSPNSPRVSLHFLSQSSCSREGEEAHGICLNLAGFAKLVWHLSFVWFGLWK